MYDFYANICGLSADYLVFVCFSNENSYIAGILCGNPVAVKKVVNEHCLGIDGQQQAC